MNLIEAVVVCPTKVCASKEEKFTYRRKGMEEKFRYLDVVGRSFGPPGVAALQQLVAAGACKW